jgi:hypothetical protein
MVGMRLAYTEGCISRSNTAQRWGFPTIVMVIAIGCFCLVTHGATDLTDLSTVLPSKTTKAMNRLEPPEYGQEESTLRTGGIQIMGLMMDGLLALQGNSFSNFKTSELHLRI